MQYPIVLHSKQKNFYIILYFYIINSITAVKFFIFIKFFPDNDAKIAFEKHLVLTCDASYIKYPKQFTLMHQEREFTISLDPVGLEAGIAHFTEVS